MIRVFAADCLIQHTFNCFISLSHKVHRYSVNGGPKKRKAIPLVFSVASSVDWPLERLRLEACSNNFPPSLARKTAKLKISSKSNVDIDMGRDKAEFGLDSTMW